MVQNLRTKTNMDIGTKQGLWKRLCYNWVLCERGYYLHLTIIIPPITKKSSRNESPINQS